MNKAKRKIRHYFNMVEVALALAVVGIGIAGIMSLFPVALNANRQAIGDNYSPDVANLFLSYVEVLCNQNDDWSVTGSFANSLPTTKPSESITESFNSSPISSTWSNIFSSGTSGLYNVSMTTDGITDFNAVIRMWRTQITGLYVNSSNPSVNVPYKYGMGIHIEITWPKEKPYDQRYKRDYYLEFFNPNI